jgi:hypothetical protein
MKDLASFIADNGRALAIVTSLAGLLWVALFPLVTITTGVCARARARACVCVCVYGYVVACVSVCVCVYRCLYVRVPVVCPPVPLVRLCVGAQHTQASTTPTRVADACSHTTGELKPRGMYFEENSLLATLMTSSVDALQVCVCVSVWGCLVCVLAVSLSRNGAFSCVCVFVSTCLTASLCVCAGAASG